MPNLAQSAINTLKAKVPQQATDNGLFWTELYTLVETGVADKTLTSVKDDVGQLEPGYTDAVALLFRDGSMFAVAEKLDHSSVMINMGMWFGEANGKTVIEQDDPQVQAALAYALSSKSPIGDA